MNSTATVVATWGEPHHNAWTLAANYPNLVGVQLTMQPYSVGPKTSAHAATNMSLCPRGPKTGGKGAGPPASRGGWLVACLTSQQQASVSQGRICSDNFTCCHTEIEVADQTFYLTQSQYTDTGLTSPSADLITPGAWQGSHWSANF